MRFNFEAVCPAFLIRKVNQSSAQKQVTGKKKLWHILLEYSTFVEIYSKKSIYNLL